MAISVKHATQAAGEDAGNGEIGKNQWNEGHALEMAASRLVGRTSAGDGPVEEITIHASLALSGQQLQFSTTWGDNRYAGKAADNTFTGNNDFDNPVGVPDATDPGHAVNLSQAQNLSGGFSAGMIVMWSGTQANIPSGWALCDGENGTPDLRGRFIVGSGGSYAGGDTGGADSVVLSESEMPQHNHSGSTGSAGSHGHSASTGNAGHHGHSGSTNTTGNHSHNTQSRDGGNVWHYQASDFHVGGNSWVAAGTHRSRNAGIQANGNHSHSLSINANGSHSHSVSINSGGSHTHSVSIGNAGSGDAHENRPPYYALAFIMKL